MHTFDLKKILKKMTLSCALSMLSDYSVKKSPFLGTKDFGTNRFSHKVGGNRRGFPPSKTISTFHQELFVENFK